MKSWIITALVVLASVGMMLVYSSSKKKKPAYREGFDLQAFGQLPVQDGGRVKPIDSFARHRLMVLRMKQGFFEQKGDEKITRSATQWLLDANLRPELASGYELFRIDHEQVLGLIGKSHQDQRKEFTLEEIRPHVDAIVEQSQQIDQKDSRDLDQYEKALLRLRNGLFSYSSVAMAMPRSIMPGDMRLSQEIEGFERTLGPGLEAAEKKARGEPYDEEVYERFELFRRLYEGQGPATAMHVIPPILRPRSADAYVQSESVVSVDAAEGVLSKIHEASIPYREKVEMAMSLAERHASQKDVREVFADYVEKWKPMVLWKTPREALLDAFDTGTIDPLVKQYAAMVDAYADGRPEAFNAAVQQAHTELEKRVPEFRERSAYEEFMNRFQPFVKALVLYICLFLVAALSWLVARRSLVNAALIILLLAICLQGYGLWARMIIMDRPMVWVTTLYSSAVFIGFVAAILCLVLEFIFRFGLASACAAVVGVLTLVVAHHLALEEGDTLKPLQAVLDTNFWLSTHVTTVTMGYAATFLAGILAIAFIVAGFVAPKLAPKTMRTLSGMVYGIVCFALLFSTVGTLLGGIWADQSWGRFWGWDPKENGALMIVLWNALILHARWGKVFNEWGVMCLVVLGNVVTAWSWFGTNLLGIGLHSYGFNSSTFWWLMGFAAFNFIIVAAGMLKSVLVTHAKRSARQEKGSGTEDAPDAQDKKKKESEPVPV